VQPTSEGFFVLLERATCRWRAVWSIGGVELRGETEVLGEKPVPVALWPPHNWYGLRCDRTGTL